MSDNPYVNKTLHNPVCTRPPVCADIPASQYKQKTKKSMDDDRAEEEGGVTVTNGWGRTMVPNLICNYVKLIL